VFAPDLYYKSVQDIDFEALRAAGIDTLLVDLDNTLLSRDAHDIPEHVVTWARETKARGFLICIVSNNWHAHVEEVADRIGLPIVAKAIKPLPFAFRTALRRLGSSSSRSAVVGDQVFTDVLGGRLMGMKTVLVTPLSTSDLPHTLLLRRLERLVLADRRPLP